MSITSVSSSKKSELLAELRGSNTAQLSSRLADLIRSGKIESGDTLPSERRLSSELNISRGAIRRVFSILESEGLVDSGAGRTRRVLPQRQTGSLMAQTILVIGFSELPNERIRSETGWDTYAQFSASARLQESGYHCLALNPDEVSPFHVRSFHSDPPAGVILCRPPRKERSREIVQQLDSLGLRIVAYDSDDEYPAWDRVYHDHTAGAATLTHWLIEQGRERILPFWRFPTPRKWIEHRELGYTQAMAEAGLDPLPALRTPDLRVKGEPEPFDDMVQLQMGFLHPYLFGDHPIDAIMCANDLHAVEAAEVVRRLGKEPGRDVLIVGYDNTWQRDRRNPRREDPPAATIDKRNGSIGIALAELLHERLHGDLPSAPQHRASDFALVTSPNADGHR
ncbi:MAG: LacI family DNA-binding transcriptional regulator [Planctomycetota bacterium]